MRQRIESPAWFRRVMLGLIVALVGAEIGLVWTLHRLLTLFAPVPADGRAGLLGLLGLVTAAQGLACVGAALVAFRVAWTTVDVDEAGLAIQDPFRRWRGPWTEVARVYRTRGLVALEVAGTAPGRFAVHPGSDAAPAVAALFGRVPSGAALGAAATRWYLARRALPLLVAVVVLGALALRLLDRALLVASLAP